MEEDYEQPQLLYQSVSFAFDVENEIIVASTTLWLAFSNEITPGNYVYLHCRQCKITEIYVNNVLSEYCLNDPLKNITPSSTSPSFNAVEIDSNYRSGLEVSRLGELRITIPSNKDTNNNINYSNLPTLPIGSPKDVTNRYENLKNIFELLKARNYNENDYSTKPVNDDNEEDDEDNNLLHSIINKQANNDNGRLLQIKIFYTLERRRLVIPSNDPAKSQGPIYSIPAGYCFRKQRDYLPNNVEDININTKAVCSYSISGIKQNKSIYDLDGIRCWLPCLDFPNQRAIYDITLYCPSYYNIAVSNGRKIHTRNHYIKRHQESGAVDLLPLINSNIKNKNNSMKNSIWYSSTRYYTHNRIPSFALGFFVGSGEGYKMPLYKCTGKIWVARNIQDYILYNNKRIRKSNEISVNDNNKVDIQIINKIENSINPSKKIRFSELSTDNKISSDVDNEETDSEEYENIFNNSNLYDELVHHSMLGFDISLRYIHKLLGKKYTYDNYTQIYVPELTVGDSIAFDGFILIDSKYLHNNKQIYLETPHHLLNLTAYLYSYISTCYPLLHYSDEYLIHGVVGYLFHLYISVIYGEDESLYYIKKCFDTVITLDKLYHCSNGFDDFSDRQRDGSIGGLTYPETYGNYLMYKGEYLVSKSVLLFHLIENILGGNESLRKAIQQVLKAPSLNSSHISPSTSPNHNPSSDDKSNDEKQIDRVDSNEDKNIKINTNDLPPPTPLYATATPSHFESYVQRQQQPYVNYTNDENTGNMSPPQSPYVYMQSPNSTSPNSYYYSSYSMMSPQSLSPGGSLSPMWSHSPNFYNSYSNVDLSYLTADCVTGEKFISVIRDNAGVSSGELSDLILQQYIYHGLYNHPLLVKLDVAVDPKVDGRPRHIHIMIDSLLNQRQAYVESIPLRFRVSELKDDRLSEPIIHVNGGSSTKVNNNTGSDNIVVHSPALYTRPGRTSGKQQLKKNLGEEKEETVELAAIPYVDEIDIHNDYINKLRKLFISHRMLMNVDMFNCDISNVVNKNSSNSKRIPTESSIQRAKNKSYPLKYVLVDPFCLNLSDVNLGSLADSLILEQLFLDIDMFDIVRQCQALKGLERSISSTIRNYPYHKQNPSNSTLYEKSPQLQFHALFDFLYSNPTNNLPTNISTNLSMNITNTNTPHMPNQSVFVRVETAFSLLQWHYDRNYAHQIHNNVHNISRYSILDNGMYWEGAILLLKFLYDLFIDPITNLPNLREDTNEWLTYLKRGVLIATSNIKSTKSYITPIEVLDFYIYLLDHFDNHIDNTSDDTTISDCHLRTILLYSISKFTYDNMNTITGNESRTYAKKIIKRVYIYLIQEIISAKTTARLKYTRNDSNLMPNLPFNSMVIAGCISCIGEIDRQAISLGYAPSITDKVDGPLYPSTVGIISTIDYAQFFLPNYLSLHHSIRSLNTLDSESDVNNNKRIKIEYNSCLNSVLVRSSAIEVYLRICAAYYLNYIQKMQEISFKKSIQEKSNPSNNNTSNNPSTNTHRDCHYLTAIVEVVLMILQHDQSLQVKHNTLYSFLALFQDYLPRTIASTISLGYKGFCYGYSDVGAYTLTPLTQYVEPTKVGSSNLSGGSTKAIQRLGIGMRSYQSGMKKELKKWWKAMAYGSGFDQISRSLLLSTWIFIYKDTTPKLLIHHHSSSPSNSASDSPSWSPMHSPSGKSNEKDSVGMFDDGSKYIPKYKLPVIFSPIDSFYKMETLLRRGSDFKPIMISKDTSKLNQKQTINIPKKPNPIIKEELSVEIKKEVISPVQAPIPIVNNESKPKTNENSVSLGGKFRLRL